MYEQFYGLRERPFSLNPDPFYLYKSKKHQKALNLMEYGLINQAAFCVITGEIGTGKTTLVRQLLHQIDKKFSIGLLTSTHHSFGELLKLILIAFNLDHRNKDKAELYQTLYDFLIEEYSRQRQIVLIIDEAQNMAPDTLEELRMLSNINVDEHNVLQMILIGQEGLRDMLRRPELEQFAQRIAVDYHLEPLDRVETHTYILHRLETAGGSKSRTTFNLEACDAVYQYTGGIPRLINMLCDVAMVYGFAEQKQILTAELIDEVALDKKGGGILPLREIAGPFDESESTRLISLHTPIEEKTENNGDHTVNVGEKNNPVSEENSPNEPNTVESNPSESISGHVLASQMIDKTPEQPNQTENTHSLPSSSQTMPRSPVFTKLITSLPDRNSDSYFEGIRAKSQPLLQKLRNLTHFLSSKGKVWSQRLMQSLGKNTHIRSFSISIRAKLFKQSVNEENNYPQSFLDRYAHWYKSLMPSLTWYSNLVIIAVTAIAIVGLFTLIGKTDFFHGHDAANVIAPEVEAMTRDLNSEESSLLTAHLAPTEMDRKGVLNEPVDVISTARLASIPDVKPSQVTVTPTPIQDDDLVIVEAGSTLSTILVEELGRYNKALLDEVLRLNPEIRNPDYIAIGQKITLPKKQQIN